MFLFYFILFFFLLLHYGAKYTEMECLRVPREVLIK